MIMHKILPCLANKAKKISKVQKKVMKLSQFKIKESFQSKVMPCIESINSKKDMGSHMINPTPKDKLNSNTLSRKFKDRKQSNSQRRKKIAGVSLNAWFSVKVEHISKTLIKLKLRLGTYDKLTLSFIQKSPLFKELTYKNRTIFS